MKIVFPRFLGWRIPRTDDMHAWAKKHLIPIEDQYVSLIKKGDTQKLMDFASLCHDLVSDRDFTFTLDRRIKLYMRWLSTGQPCLQAINNTEGYIIGASIVLPLTQVAYDEYCFGDLDALDIETYHIESRVKSSRQHLLIDMLAVDEKMAHELPAIGYSSVIRHIARFYNPNKQKIGPVVFCSTVSGPLSRRLRQMELQLIERHKSPTYTLPVYFYRADFNNTDLYSPQAREYYSSITELIRLYNK